jgi:Secretion system C-terminal sorting domain
MKKITLITLSFALFYNVLQSQNFAPIGTKWRFNYGAISGRGYIDYEALTDTVINGLTCRRISYKQKCTFGNGLSCPPPSIFDNQMFYFHERNDSLFRVYRGGETYLVFNFKANVGDTLKYAIDDITVSGNTNSPIVTRKSDTLIGGQRIKFWELTQKCLSWAHYPTFKFKIYEKIYSMTDGLFVFGRCEGTIEFYAELCYFNDGNFRFDPSNCLRTSLNNLNKSASITISPNPSSDKLIINSPIIFSKYAIYNTTGQLIQNTTAIDANDINISQLSKGFYLLQLIDNEGISINKKFIKL